MNLLKISEQYPLSAGYKTGGASQEAAEMMTTSGKMSFTQGLIMRLLNAGFVGDAEAIASAIGMAENKHSVRSRLTELSEMGLVEKLDDRSEAASSGIRCHKWRAIA